MSRVTRRVYGRPLTAPRSGAGGTNVLGVQPATFADAGTAFPLFEGPVAHALDVLGKKRCLLCGRDGFCLELAIGHDLIGPCQSCGAQTDFSVDGPFDRCVSCEAVCRLTSRVEGRPACLTCLQEGRFAITKGSELGMVRWRDARSGLTHGLPLTEPATTYRDFPAEQPNESGWQRIRVDDELLLQLVLTPDFETVQGSVWRFHCGRPMAFIGRWGKRDFEQHAPDGDGAAFALRLAELDEEPYSELGDTANDGDAWLSAYAFRCTACGALAAYWDA